MCGLFKAFLDSFEVTGCFDCCFFTGKLQYTMRQLLFVLIRLIVGCKFLIVILVYMKIHPWSFMYLNRLQPRSQIMSEGQGVSNGGRNLSNHVAISHTFHWYQGILLLTSSEAILNWSIGWYLTTTKGATGPLQGESIGHRVMFPPMLA